MDPCYSVARFRYAYAGIIPPMTDMSQWPTIQLDFEVLAPLTRRAVGRQRKNRIPGCMEEGKCRTKGKWQVLCKSCEAKGHRASSSKCPYNGPKKRKSRAKQQQPGRKKDTSEAEPSSQGTNKRQKLTEAQALVIFKSPGPVTRRQMALTTGAQGTSPNSPDPVTRRQLALSGEGLSSQLMIPSTGAVSPPKATVRKKLTPRKGKKLMLE